MVELWVDAKYDTKQVKSSEGRVPPLPIAVSKLKEVKSASFRNDFDSRTTVSVIIPAKNEAKNLPYVLPLIPAWVHEVLLVDGNSTDDTVAVARNLLPQIRIVQQKGRGKGAALRTGFAAATGDIIVMIDADGSMDPGEIPAFVGALLAGADFAKGSRFLQGGGTFDMSWIRYVGNWVLTNLVRLIFGGQYSDLCYGYNAFWKWLLPTLNLDADGFEIETLMNVRALRAHLKVTEIPSFEAERIYGESNLNTFRDGWRVLKTIVRERVKALRGEALTSWKRDSEHKSILRRQPINAQYVQRGSPALAAFE
jgi:glycosyltransferase involved in cell wall biosynthesis